MLFPVGGGGGGGGGSTGFGSAPPVPSSSPSSITCVEIAVRTVCFLVLKVSACKDRNGAETIARARAMERKREDCFVTVVSGSAFALNGD